MDQSPSIDFTWIQIQTNKIKGLVGQIETYYWILDATVDMLKKALLF